MCWNAQLRGGAVSQLSSFRSLGGRPACPPITACLLRSPLCPSGTVRLGLVRDRSLAAPPSAPGRLRRLDPRDAHRPRGWDQGRAGVLRPDRVDQVLGVDRQRAGPAWQGLLQACLRHQYAEVGTLPPVVAHSIDTEEEGFRLVLQLMPVQRRSTKHEGAVIIEVVLTGGRRCLCALDGRRSLLYVLFA